MVVVAVDDGDVQDFVVVVVPFQHILVVQCFVGEEDYKFAAADVVVVVVLKVEEDNVVMVQYYSFEEKSLKNAYYTVCLDRLKDNFVVDYNDPLNKGMEEVRRVEYLKDDNLKMIGLQKSLKLEEVSFLVDLVVVDNILLHHEIVEADLDRRIAFLKIKL